MTLKQRIYRLLLNLRQNTYRLFCVIIVCLAAAFGLNSSVFADVAFVDGSVVACDNEGDSWAAAFKFLQDALDFAAVPQNNIDQIWVAAGAGPYYPDQDYLNPGGTGNRALSFDMISAVEAYGGFRAT